MEPTATVNRLELLLGETEMGLSPRSFVINQAMSTPFSLRVWASSTAHDIDLEGLIGRSAALRIRWSVDGERTWSGVCTNMRQLRTETKGESRYVVQIDARLALLARRTNQRVFNYKSTIEIISTVLAEWRIEPEWRLDAAAFPQLELRAQYGESDLDFVERLLQEAGLSYFFEFDADATRLVLTETPQSAEPRQGGPIPFVDEPNPEAGQEFVTHVAIERVLRGGTTTVVDHDFWRQPKFLLSATGERGLEFERGIASAHYAPGRFLEGAAPADKSPKASATAPTLSEELDASGGSMNQFAARISSGTAGDAVTKVAQLYERTSPTDNSLVADDRGRLRHIESRGKVQAEAQQDSLNAVRHQITFETNAFDIAPGRVIRIDHPRPDLTPEQKLLVLAAVVRGDVHSAWDCDVQATFAKHAYRPAMTVKKARIFGQQSAVVVGPPGEEIHTDEFGRVRVQFHWDLEGEHNDMSLCWVRVSQPWAGPGYGAIALPRVGQEVLVSFLDGDPDLPVVTGCLFNYTAPVPHRLPEHRARTTIKSSTTPGGNGFNELSFDDTAGREVVFVHAQRDMQVVARKHHAAVVGDTSSLLVGTMHHVSLRSEDGSETFIELVEGKITLSTGKASLVLDGADIAVRAEGKVIVQSSGDDVVVQGGPWVKINPDNAEPQATPQTPPPPPAPDHPTAPAAEPTHGAALPAGAAPPATNDAVEKFAAPQKQALASLTRAEKSLERWNQSDKAAVAKWFGNSDAKVRATLLERVRNAKARVAAMKATDLQPVEDKYAGRGYLAYVYGDDPKHNLYVSDDYWNMPVTGLNSQSQVLVHEVGHFSDVAGLEDYTYGIPNSLELAKKSPAAALKNNDNFTYWAVQR